MSSCQCGDERRPIRTFSSFVRSTLTDVRTPVSIYPEKLADNLLENAGTKSGSFRMMAVPVACLGDAPFGYVNVFTSHVNVGFFHGAALPDPARLLQGTGKFMRHVKLRPETPTNAAALNRLINTAYSDIKARVENG